MDRALGIIPARGGSKGLPGKNLMVLGGQSLVERTIRAAVDANALTMCIVTTDSLDILYEANRLRAPIIHRPPELATDEAGMVPTLQHVVRWSEEQGVRYDLVVCLQPTSPFRIGEDIAATLRLVTDTGADSAQTLVETHQPWSLSHLQGDRVRHLYPAAATVDWRRQDGDPVYMPNGAVYVVRTETLMKYGRLIGADHRGWVMPVERSININTALDFKVAEMLLAR